MNYKIKMGKQYLRELTLNKKQDSSYLKIAAVAKRDNVSTLME